MTNVSPIGQSGHIDDRKTYVSPIGQSDHSDDRKTYQTMILVFMVITECSNMH